MVMRDLDSFVPDDHTARAVWQFIDRMEISALYASIKSVLCSPGRPATDPQTLLALWVYATVEGVGSARRLEKLCEEHDVYRWLAGGVAHQLPYALRLPGGEPGGAGRPPDEDL